MAEGMEKATRRIPWLSMSAMVLIAAAILVAVRPQIPLRASDRGAAAPVLRAAVAEGGSVRITWPAGTGAGELAVEDGGVWNAVELDARARAAGEYVYRPGSSEVLVQMGAESVRVMGLNPAPVVVAQAVPPPPATAEPAEQTADRAIAPTTAVAVERKTPQVLPRALRGIHGVIRVDVRVAVAVDGSVQSAELIAPARSSYFNRLSMEAARGSVYPASSGGTTVTLRYEYSRDGVQVSSPAGQ